MFCILLQYFHNGADTIEDQMTLVASTGTKTSMPATLIIRILPVNDEMPVLVNNTGLEIWAGATTAITKSTTAYTTITTTTPAPTQV